MAEGLKLLLIGVLVVLMVVLGLRYSRRKQVDDETRVREALARKRRRLVSMEWSPFVPGAFVCDSGDRAYEVVYVDDNGVEATVGCVLNWRNEIFWQDEDSRPTPPEPSPCPSCGGQLQEGKPCPHCGWTREQPANEPSPDARPRG